MSESWHEAASEWSADCLAQSAGCSVSVNNGTYTTAPIGAVVGSTSVEQWQDRGIGGTFTTTDFTIRGTQLIFNGVVQLPLVGWRITWIRKGITEIYEVLKPSQEKDCYTPAGQYRDSLRIHTKLLVRE